jgi:hypothetical protein
MKLRIANGTGFWGDWLDAPRQIVDRTEVDYLTLEYLAELTMSILAGQRRKDAKRGYASDFVEVLKSIAPAIRQQAELKIITNAGGMNPPACAQAAAEVLVNAGLSESIIGVVTGDDLLASGLVDGVISGLSSGTGVAPVTEEPLSLHWRDARATGVGDAVAMNIVSANAYLGARGIVEALAGGARIVITGRVADASLTVGPAVHHFGWAWDDWNRLAGATVAGHLIECGAQVTGGYSTAWQSVPNLANIGYPIAELEADGSCVITKPPATGGRVNRQTVVEQLVYEIDDPRRYVTPDVVADFTSVTVNDLGEDRVAVTGARGKTATDTYKVSVASEDGFMTSGQLVVYGEDCIAKAHACAEIIFERLRSSGQLPARRDVELLGSGMSVPCNSTDKSISEVVLRIAVADHDRAKLERFTREIAPLITGGPAGLAGYAAGRSAIRPVLGYGPALVPKKLIRPVVEVKRASQWVESTEY